MIVANSINVKLVDSEVRYMNCSIVLDNADKSIRIQNGTKTVAHYNPDEVVEVVQRVSYTPEVKFGPADEHYIIHEGHH